MGIDDVLWQLQLSIRSSSIYHIADDLYHLLHRHCTHNQISESCKGATLQWLGHNVKDHVLNRTPFSTNCSCLNLICTQEEVAIRNQQSAMCFVLCALAD